MNPFPEFKYLTKLIDYRLNNSSGKEIPVMPDVETWGLPVKKFLSTYNFNNDRKAPTLLLISLVPYVFPQLFDQAIQEKLKTSGDFPEIGGVRGKNSRAFLPTGETALFLLAGDDLQTRLSVQHLFGADHLFAQKRILWLEDLPPGEPPMSGRIILSQDYADTFVYGKPSPPHFSITFPARRIREERSWQSLVINEELQNQIEEITAWLKYNDELMYKWGMHDRLKKGFRALFYGPPGTGKTLTAGLLANEIGRDIYKIDLSMVVSKFIGETEKNLELLFARAEDKGWILFFDEADALFGKRTNVRDAHDKYANQEVSYLLQRIEDYNGLIILATNMKSNIDDAFMRRFNAILKFPFPDPVERALIWEKSFPQYAVFAKERGIHENNGTEKSYLQKINIAAMVKKYELAGGSIINAVHYASLKAIERASSGQRREKDKLLSPSPESAGQLQMKNNIGNEASLVIYLSDVLHGIKRELSKEGKPFVP